MDEKTVEQRQREIRHHTGRPLPHTDKTKRKISKGLKRYYRNGGKAGMQDKHHNESTKEKIRKSNKGKAHQLSEQGRKSLIDSMKKRKVTDETRKKNSESHKGIMPKNIDLLKSPKVIRKRANTLAKTLEKKLREGKPVGYSTILGGKRKDLDYVFFRSTWEANYARYLAFVEIVYYYEPKSFEYPITKGTRFYTPDFYLPEEDKWVEVKGQWDSKSKTKLRRFRKYHKDEFDKLYIITGDIWGKSKTAKSVRRFLLCDLELPPERIISYPAIAKKYKSIINNWE